MSDGNGSALATRNGAAAQTLEAVLMMGDLKSLTSEQRLAHIARICDSLGLNPLTRPFEYLTLNGKLVLYAKKDCTDQLRSIHGVSIEDMKENVEDGVLTVTVKVRDKHGRTDMDVGSVTIDGLTKDALANARMKAATKAKRRATLSICGLGLLDETEIEIPGAVPPAGAGEAHSPTPPAASPAPSTKVLNPATGRMVDPNSANQLRKGKAWESLTDKLQGFQDARDADGLRAWWADDVTPRIASWNGGWREEAERLFEEAIDAIEAAERHG